MKTGYSQNNEQELILNFFKDKKFGTLVDIGANNGLDNSNTRALIELGWDGVLIEPSSSAFTKLENNCLSYPNLVLMNIAIAETDGIQTFYECSDDQTSTLNTDWAERVKKYGFKYTDTLIETKTVKTLFPSGATIDFLSIDAEGCDIGILKQFIRENIFPTLISIECSGKERIEIQSFLQIAGYKLYHTTGENLIMNK